MGRDEMIEQLRKSLQFLSSEYYVRKIAIFGSVARDEIAPDSDVDLLVEFSAPIGFRLNQLVEYLENLLGRKVDLITRDGIRNIRVKEVAESIEETLLYV